jgi:putative phosphoesterase
MRVAAIYDIHGNLPALEGVLEDVRQAGVDLIVVGGDVVPGPMPVETIAALLNLDARIQFIQGNGEVAVLSLMDGTDPTSFPEQARESLLWTAQQLQPDHQRLLAGWPKTLRMPVEGLGDVLFCHATPGSDTEIFTRLAPERQLSPVFAGIDVPVVVCGHTHMQFDRTIGKVRVVNAGSVGMPFGQPGAYWLLLGPDIALRRTPYDLNAAASRIRATAYPQAREFAAHNVVQPPSEQATLALFHKAGAK